MSALAIRKSDQLTELLVLASYVDTSAPARQNTLSAREAARNLSGLASWVANRQSMDAMQEAMSRLAIHGAAWKGPVYLCDLPVEIDGRVDPTIAMIAVVCSGMIHTFGAQNLRSAVAFWATSRDAASWRKVIEA